MPQWLSKLFRGKKVSAPKRPVAPHRIGFNMHYWRTRPDLIAFARQLFATTEFQQMLSVLHAETPRGYATDPGTQLGRMNGWRECLLCLEAMADIPPVVAEELESSFGAENEFRQPAEATER